MRTVSTHIGDAIRVGDELFPDSGYGICPEVYSLSLQGKNYLIVKIALFTAHVSDVA